ncbi:uncharacterized protein LOC133791536 [Humulus lupulus]|uniref:uncharacterized protein LOC133791536 n=1 Tax=Humulus lupulus TaxID=3486 RepID=UPI002B414602|nr:uncharacterized protein LOC133791536 [Humulus lupulus]
MSSYVKFMKEILSKKRRLEDFETVALTEECSAILQRKLPQKLQYSGSFTIPCTIGKFECKHALCDLGASINLMPLSIFRKLGLGETKPTTITLQLADRSIKHPRGVIEDVLVKVDKFIFPADFIVLDMEDTTVPIILGRPFLATGQALIDVQKGELRLRVQGEKVVFNVFKAMSYPRASDSCFNVDVIDEVVSKKKRITNDPLELAFALGDDNEAEDWETHEYVKWINSYGPYYKKKFEELGQVPECPIPSIEKPPDLELKSYRSIFRNYPFNGYALLLMEEDSKPSIEAQRRQNPSTKDVVQKQVFNWLDAGMVYPISDSAWVSLVQVVPKKGGMTVVKNENNELIPTRTVAGWRICIDYHKLNKAMRKDHFPLPFVDQMLDRLAGHSYYCFLDGYSRYHQIAFAPEDQEKTTFTCPYGTFAFRWMPFGLCNAPATFQRCMMAIFSDMVEKSIEVFMDDFSVFGSDFDVCLDHLEVVLKRCEESNLVLNWEKCHFMVK